MKTSGYYNLNRFGNKLIEGINAFIFLFALSIGALVLPSMLPLTTFLGVLLLIYGCFFSLVSDFGFTKNINKLSFIDNINYGNLLIPVIGLILLLLIYSAKAFHIKFNFISGFAALVLHVGFLVFIVNTKKYLLTYIRTYIYFCFFMSFCSIIAISLLYSGVVDSSSNYINISELTGGAFNRDDGSENSYIFPYNLGLILTGGGKLNLLGFSFFRISGWAHEPTSATLFVAPAIILLLHSKVISKTFYRISALIVIVFFWFFAMSLGSVLAFSILYFMYILSFLFTKIYPLKFSTILTFSVMILMLAGVFYFDELLDSSLIASKIDFSSETFQSAMSRLTFFMPETAITQANSFSFIFIYLMMFFFFANIAHSFFIEKEFNPYALVLLYILIHSMKGSQDSVFLLTFCFFWFYVLHFSIPNNQTKSVK